MVQSKYCITFYNPICCVYKILINNLTTVAVKIKWNKKKSIIQREVKSGNPENGNI